MGVVGLDHVQLAIPAGGEEKARGFYRDVLGLSEVPKPAILSPGGCWFEGGSLNLHLGIDPDFRPATKAHPALVVDDLESMRTRIEDAGYPATDDKPLPSIARFFTQDPFGNRIEIMQHLTWR